MNLKEIVKWIKFIGFGLLFMPLSPKFFYSGLCEAFKIKRADND